MKTDPGTSDSRDTTLDIVVLGLSITSSWGNGHATTFRALVRELAARGHKVLFLERDVPWYRGNRDLPCPSFCETRLYDSLDQLRDCFADPVRHADLVIVGSYVPDGITVGDWVNATAGGVTAFYDIDTPVTLARLRNGTCDYLTPAQVSRYNAYFSFAGGKVLRLLEEELGAPMARPLYCSVDPNLYEPEERGKRYDLGYMGTYSADRQPPLERLLVEPARAWPDGRFSVAGPQYPDTIEWPKNIERIDHLSPGKHRRFYNEQRFTLNITRSDMIAMGWSPSVRLFEAGACATPVISDWWPGLDEFFVPGKEILISQSPEETLRYLREIDMDSAAEIGRRARDRILSHHTAAHRAAELEKYFSEAWKNRRRVAVLE